MGAREGSTNPSPPFPCSQILIPILDPKNYLALRADGGKRKWYNLAQNSLKTSGRQYKKVFWTQLTIFPLELESRKTTPRFATQKSYPMLS